MFTGIIEETGKIINIRKDAKSAALTVRAGVIFEDLKPGDSVSVNGVCLTVTDLTKDTFTADIMHETLSRSSLGELKAGSAVNLERALAVSGRFGGHIVSGHIDGTGTITKIKNDGNAVWYTVKAPPQIMKYIVEKGSVAIDGVSLTVAGVSEDSFSVSVIPHTSKNTALSLKAAGDTVNLENDIIGKYVEKLMSPGQAQTPQRNITKEFLNKHGF